MTETGTIVRVAAKGDGVTANGRHVAGAVTGDRIEQDGELVPGPHHVTPPCRHFGRCGGCQLQHADEHVLAEFVTDRVVRAAEGQGLAIGALLPAHLSPPRSRRRASLLALNGGGRPLIGFREAGSHRVIDLAQCDVLHPQLFAVIGALRPLLARRKGRFSVEIDLTLADQGVDLALRNLPLEGLSETEAMLEFAGGHGLARLSLDQGYGPETVWEPEPVTITLGEVPVGLPPGSFLQATADGERALAADTARWLEGCAVVADLFAGLGTFAFAISGQTRVLAAEAARDAHLAMKLAAARTQRPVAALHRDLFRNPLQPDELDRFAGVVLDPPRAGAREQVAHLAMSRVPRVVYVSCNPASWARDAKTLVEGGYRLEWVHPVGQFRWSTHVELTSLFVRD